MFCDKKKTVKSAWPRAWHKVKEEGLNSHSVMAYYRRNHQKPVFLFWVCAGRGSSNQFTHRLVLVPWVPYHPRMTEAEELAVHTWHSCSQVDGKEETTQGRGCVCWALGTQLRPRRETPQRLER